MSFREIYLFVYLTYGLSSWNVFLHYAARERKERRDETREREREREDDPDSYFRAASH